MINQQVITAMFKWQIFYFSDARSSNYALFPREQKNYYQFINLFRFFPVSNTIFTEKTDALTKIQTTHNYLDEGQKNTN